MSLIYLNNKNTDKNSTHSYLELYERLLNGKKYTAKNILEIGIGPKNTLNGGSILIWYNYFPNANIYALDIIHIDDVWNGIKNIPRVHLLTSTDAYDEQFFKNNLLNMNIKFDVVLDDGPHTLDSMKKFIKLYSQILADDGVLIIEDVQDINWINELKNEVPNNLKKYIEVYDRRHIKNRYDDIVFLINKSNYVEHYNNTRIVKFSTIGIY